MSYCPECGTELHDNENFCPECGTEINVVGKDSTAPLVEEYYEEETPAWHQWIKTSLKVVLVFIGAFVAFIVIIDKYGTKNDNHSNGNTVKAFSVVENGNTSESGTSLSNAYERQMEEQRNQEKERLSKIRSQISSIEYSFDREFENIENTCKIVVRDLGGGWPLAPNTVENMEYSLQGMVQYYNQIYSLDPSYEKLGEMQSKINTARKAIIITQTNIDRYNDVLR